ncbi:hypothetical protein NHX12_017506 [Muraenolepis orangiensis]|uniref:Uncharacterized protein n=1 Tax=Muraenolepis orangiensis TaxID=630683 RepID=A0A9Q0EUR6_9TELE|nr:hypothetical protein NHX12_017506 [Muraenolepis orangiensis]
MSPADSWVIKVTQEQGRVHAWCGECEVEVRHSIQRISCTVARLLPGCRVHFHQALHHPQVSFKEEVSPTIWTLILGNASVITGTTLQLVEVNQTTLIQRHNKRVAR